MKGIVTAIVLGMLTFSVSIPASAQHVTPSSSNFTAFGAAFIGGSTCNLALAGTTNSAGMGGIITGGTYYGSGLCSLITIDSGATFAIDTYDSTGNGSADATLNGVIVRIGNFPPCTQASPISFRIDNDGAGGSRISLTNVVGVCSFAFNVDTSDVTVTL